MALSYTALRNCARSIKHEENFVLVESRDNFKNEAVQSCLFETTSDFRLSTDCIA
jgi:hypothetical protein